MAGSRTWVTRHPVAFYVVVAYAVSWSIAVPLALQANGALPGRLPWSLHYLTAYGPAVAAWLAGRLVREPAGADGRVERSGSGRSIRWWAVGFGVPLLFFAIAQVVTPLAGQSAPAWSELGRVNFLPDLGVAAWFLWFLTSGCGEELGWRGFALPRLQRTHSAAFSSLLVAIVWAGWHLPALLYLPSYAAIGLRILPGFFLGILAGSIVLTWLYNRSGGSVLAVALWHGSFNFVTGSPAASGATAAVTSVLVMVWAGFVLLWYDWSTFTQPRVAGGRRASVH